MVEVWVPTSIHGYFIFVNKEIFSWPSRQNPTFFRCASFPIKKPYIFRIENVYKKIITILILSYMLIN